MYGVVEKVLPSFMKRPLRVIWTLGFIQLPALVVLAFLFLVRPFKSVKILLLFERRIGELASRTDLFLRRRHVKGGVKNSFFYIGVVGKPCNEQLLRMFKRKLRILQSQYALTLCTHSILRKSPFVELLPSHFNEFDEYNNIAPSLTFTEREEKTGKSFLSSMGIPDGGWFVCFHTRDSVYLDQLNPGKDWSYHDFRDCSVNNYIEAMKYISVCGGYAVRMGAGVAQELPDDGDSRIIDYASKHRTHFGDIYLPARCKFFVGCSSGLWLIPLIFNVPVVLANTIPLKFTPFGEQALFLPKPIWSLKKKRLLSLREILESDICNFETFVQYREAELQVLENSPEEILAVTKEMNGRVDGHFRSTEEDEELQRRFHSLIQPHHVNYGTTARIGTEYLRTHRDLLD